MTKRTLIVGSILLVVIATIVSVVYVINDKQNICSSYDAGIRGGACLPEAPEYCGVIIVRAKAGFGYQDGAGCGYIED